MALSFAAVDVNAVELRRTEEACFPELDGKALDVVLTLPGTSLTLLGATQIAEHSVQLRFATTPELQAFLQRLDGHLCKGFGNAEWCAFVYCDTFRARLTTRNVPGFSVLGHERFTGTASSAVTRVQLAGGLAKVRVRFNKVWSTNGKAGLSADIVEMVVRPPVAAFAGDDSW